MQCNAMQSYTRSIVDKPGKGWPPPPDWSRSKPEQRSRGRSERGGAGPLHYGAGPFAAGWQLRLPALAPRSKAPAVFIKPQTRQCAVTFSFAFAQDFVTLYSCFCPLQQWQSAAHCDDRDLRRSVAEVGWGWGEMRRGGVGWGGLRQGKVCKNRRRALPGQYVEGKWVQLSGAARGVGGRGCGPLGPQQAAALQGCAAAAMQPPPQQRGLTLLHSMDKHAVIAHMTAQLPRQQHPPHALAMMLFAWTS